LKIKLKGRNFDTNEVMAEESQAVLNILTEQYFQGQKRWERCIRVEGDCFEGDSGQHAQTQFLTRWQHQFRKLWKALCIGTSGTEVAALVPLFSIHVSRLYSEQNGRCE
jgi:hypothetical protein